MFDFLVIPLTFVIYNNFFPLLLMTASTATFEDSKKYKSNKCNY